jgi:hypothetical protein
MTRLALALSLAGFFTLALLPAQAQQAAGSSATPSNVTQTADGKTCKKVYVQKKSARTGQYVHVPRQKCA